MKEIKIDITIRHYQTDELSDSDQQLIEAAKKATHNAYAPYSHFNVGAALRLEDGSIVIGANQENAAFPSGLCAERTAIFAAQATHPELSIDTLAIAASNMDGFINNPITPCGACRQVILGMEDRYKKPVRILLYGKKGVYMINTLKDLLPLSFIDDNMHN